MLNVPDHPYGREVKGYLSGRVAVPGPWLSVGRKPGGGNDPLNFDRYPRFKHVQLPGDPGNMPEWEDNVQRDTVKLCECSDYRRCLLGMELQDTHVIIGRDLEPRRGLMVRLTEQGKKRRTIRTPHGPTAHHWASKSQQEHARRGKAENGVGEIVRVNGNWTCDVKWAADGSTGSGYAVGGQGGRNCRAFHLVLVEPVISIRPKTIENDAIKNICRAQMRCRPGWSGSPGAPSLFSKGSCKIIK